MVRTSFNNNWSVRPKTSIFADLQGTAAGSTAVTLPHDALLTLDRGEHGEGGHNAYFPSAAFEYAKQFDVPEEWRSKRITLEFEGVYRDAMIYVNGVHAAQRPNGYSTFAVPLDAYLQYGISNTIRVDARAHRDSRWYSGIGIHRDVWLHVEEHVHIARNGVAVTTPDIEQDRAVVTVTTALVNESTHTTTIELETTAHAPGGAPVASDTSPVTLRPGGQAVVRQRLIVHDPQLWGVDSSVLYEAVSKVREAGTDLDSRITRFGIRRLQVDPERGLRINGETVKLRGACIHHDNGLLGARAFGRADERRIELLKEAGFNAIRSAHNPLSDVMLDACDRLGVLVMDEAFDLWAESKSSFDYSLAFPEWWERDLEAMVLKDLNHPSVIMYSIGNEIPETGTPLGAELGRRLAEKIRALDPTRLVTNGINAMISVLPDVVAMMRQRGAAAGGFNETIGSAEDMMNRIGVAPFVSEKTAESFAVLDVAGINYAEDRYALDAELYPNRVIVGSETFPRAIDRNWALVQQWDHVIGDFTWTGWDYLGEVGIGRARYTDEETTFEAPYPWLTAWCGDIDITGHRRPQSYYREIVFGLRHQPYLAVARPEQHGRAALPGQWSWTDALPSWTWDVPEGTPITVEVYSADAEIELQLNGVSVGRAPAGAKHRYTAVFETAYAPGILEAVAYDPEGRETGRSTLRTAAPAQLHVTADRTRLIADHRDLAHVTVELRDAEGELNTAASVEVTVTVTGAGELLALGTGRPDPVQRFDRPTHHSYDGRALAVIRPTGEGNIRLTVAAPDLDPVEVVLTAERPIGLQDPTR